MVTINKNSQHHPEIPIGTRVYCKVNKKMYEKVVNEGILSRWVTATGATMLSSDEHIYNTKSFKIVKDESEIKNLEKH